MRLKVITLAALACLAVPALSACASLKAEPPSVTIKALADAGCKGSFAISFGGGTGQLGGGFQGSNTFAGSCDPANARPAAIAVTPANVAAAQAAATAPAVAPPPTF